MATRNFHFTIVFCFFFGFAVRQGSCLTELQIEETEVENLRKYTNLVHAVTTLVRPSTVNNLRGNIDALEDIFHDFDNSQCAEDLSRILSNLKESWALRMLDASAKPHPGLMDLNLNWLGDYYECQHVSTPPANGSLGFSGRYCTFKWIIQTKKNFSAGISTGLCVPKSCSADQLKNVNVENNTIYKFASMVFNLSQVNVSDVSCRMEGSFDAGTIVTLCLLGVFWFLMVAGTSLTILEKWRTNHPQNETVAAHPSSIVYTVLEDSGKEANIQETNSLEDSNLEKFFKCFCVITNGAKILSLDAKGGLPCIHGIRFLSMTWVILGHTHAFALTSFQSANIKELLDDIDNVPFQAILQGTFSVDSFFLLSGFLLSYLFLKEASKNNGKIPWGFFYAHRYWRLTPVYAIVLAFNTTVTVHLADGPSWPNDSSDINCRKSWWWNILYINNFQSQAEMCMGWTWYLANDMQFYVISPIFLYALWRWPKAALSMISGVMLSSWIATGIISKHYHLLPGYTSLAKLASAPDASILQKMQVYFEKVYIRPYTRIGPYLIGIALGYAVWQQINHKRPLTKVVQTIGWALALFGGLGVVYGFYNSDPNEGVSALYNALTRSVFAASLAWVIYACLSDCGGMVNAILSWKYLIPLSRLTYCAYLVHPIIIHSFYGSLRTSLQPTHSLMTTLFLGFLVMSYLAAFVCSLAFESSLMAVEKLVLSKFRKS